MKLVFASAFLALPALSFVSTIDRYCMFPLQAEANPNDTATFAMSVRTQFSGKNIAIENVPHRGRDVVAFYPYFAADGSYGTVLKLDGHGRLALDALSIERRGSLLFAFVNNQAISELQIDQCVSNGKIYILSEPTKTDVESMKKDWRLIGQRKR